MATVWVGYWIKFEISVAETYSDIEICKVVRFAKQLTAFTRYFCNILKIKIFDVWLGSEHTPRQGIKSNQKQQKDNTVNIYLFKVINRNTRKKVWNVFKVNNKNIVSFKHISHLFLLFLLLTKKNQMLTVLFLCCS